MPSAGASGLQVVDLRCEYKINPLGIDSPAPRLSWRLEGTARGIAQTAYQIRVAETESALRTGKPLIWDSGFVRSSDSVQVPYNGPALQSGHQYYWQVRIWDNHDAASAWSAPAHWEMGLLKSSDWRASWIEPDLPNDAVGGPAPLLRREFDLSPGILRARLSVTSHGLYELQLNGRRVGDQVFTPGWTSYNKRIQYQTYDVTDLLKSGHNAIGAMLGSGWYRYEGRHLYGDHLALLLQLHITYGNGREQIIATDSGWKSSTGPILMSEIYNGETYDARLEKANWTQPGFNDSAWSGVRTANYAKDNLVAPAGPPVRRIQELKPVKMLRTPAGETVFDMGQNMVGWVRLKLRGPAGTTVTVRHAEVLDPKGNFYTENLRKAAATVRYTLKGDGQETFEPHFTFQGFRYVAVDGYPGEPTPDSVTGIVIHSDMQPSSEFTTSNPLINQLQHNILWGQKGNFLDVPTDCPQRDERLGWTGDAEVFARTAAFNMDVAGFFTKWLRDMAADQRPNGIVPQVIPDTTGADQTPRAAAGWSDAAVIIPWTIYLTYGDKRILEQQYPSMVKWVEYERQRAGDSLIWKNDFQYGDWLAYASPSGEARFYPGASTGSDLIATAFFANSTDLLQRTATVLGKKDDASKYSELLAKIKAAFRREFVTDSGRVGENTQTAYVLALAFDLLPEESRPVAARRLADDVRQRKHITTGFLGTPFLCSVLTRYGYLDEAYMLLNNERYPGWLYPVRQGATTIWERWDGIKPDGSFPSAEMNSFNHYAYGSIGDWMYRVVAGIEVDPAAPGYKHILIQPQPGGGLTSVAVSHLTPYGKVSSSWQLTAGSFSLTVDIPPNTTATVRLPHAQLAQLRESGEPISGANGINGARQDGEAVVLDAGSGTYRFSFPWSATHTAQLER
ncbi:MAG TPA: glycoside hydrolase family 78 protein [Terriglobales bacterium]